MTLNNSPARPFYRWRNDRAPYLTHILPFFKSFKSTYIEPFFGSGSVYFPLFEKGLINSSILNDKQEEIYLCVSILRDFPDLLEKELWSPIYKSSEKHYAALRKIRSSRLNSIQKAARFIYLINNANKGLYRLNKYGEFVIPYGHHPRDKDNEKEFVDFENLRRASEVLKNAQIFNEYFSKIIEKAQSGDIIHVNAPGVLEEPPAKFMENLSLSPNQYIELCNDLTKAHARGAKFFIILKYDDFYLRVFKNFGFVLLESKSFFHSSPKITEFIVHNFDDNHIVKPRST